MPCSLFVKTLILMCCARDEVITRTMHEYKMTRQEAEKMYHDCLVELGN